MLKVSQCAHSAFCLKYLTLIIAQSVSWSTQLTLQGHCKPPTPFFLFTLSVFNSLRGQLAYSSIL